MLRFPLIALLALLAAPFVDQHVDRPRFLGVLAIYLLIDLGWVVLAGRCDGAPWLPWVSTAVDVLVLTGLAAASGGPTSLMQPVFFLLPIMVSFYGRPGLTGSLGATASAGYLAVWLTRPGQDGGPELPPVVYLHTGFLLWLTAATTCLSVVVLRRQRAVRDLSEVRRRLVAHTLRIEERERTDLAERLHDGPLQALLAARLRLEEVRDDALMPPSASTADPLAPVLADLRACAGQIRSAVTVLHPQVLSQLGLTAALRELAGEHTARTGHLVDVELDEVGRPAVQTLLYGVARELLANVARHARATRVALTLQTRKGDLVLTVTDDGIGFDPAILGARIAAGHIGLGAHGARVSAAGGVLDIRPATPNGTTVCVRLPCASTVPVSPAES